MKEVIELLEKGKESEQCYRHSIGAICPCCMRFMKLIDQALSLFKPELLTAECRKCDKPFQTTSDKDRLCPDCQEKPEPSGELEDLVMQIKLLMPDKPSRKILVDLATEYTARIEQLEEKSAFAVRRIKRDRVRIEQLTERIKELRKWLVKIDHSTHNMLSATRHKSAVRLIEIHDWCEQAMKEEAKDGKPKIH